MTSPEDEPIDVVASAGDLDPVVGLLREFLHHAGAIRVVAVVDRGEEVALVDCARLEPIAVTIGERTVVLPHAIELDAAPLPVPEVRQLPPFEVSVADLKIASPLGGLEHYAIAVHGLSAVLPGDRSAAMATWETTDPDVPLSITARGDDPFVVALGEEEFEMDPEWPATPR